MKALLSKRTSLGLKARLSAMLLVALLPLLLLSLDNFRVSRANEAERNEARLADSARAVANLLSRVILQGKTLVAALAINGELLLALPPAACRDRLLSLDDLDAQLPWNFEIADADGWSQCSLTANLNRINIADRDYFSEVLATRAVVLGTIVIGKRTGIQLLPIAAPILDEKKSLRGVVRAAIPTKWLIEYAAKITGGEPYAVQIYDDAGQLLVDQSGDAAQVSIHASWQTTKDPSREVQVIQSGERLVAIASAWPGRLNVAVIVDRAVVNKKGGTSQFFGLLLAILASVVGLAVTWWFADRAVSGELNTPTG